VLCDFVVLSKGAFYAYKCIMYIHARDYAVAQLVEALRYKPEGRGFDS
jgi:hypothetical protein